MAGFLLLALLVVSYLGFALLALSQDRHWHHVSGARHCPQRIVLTLRTFGYALLLLALFLAVLRDGPSFGTLLWGTTISVVALAVVATLTWRANWLLPLVRLCRLAG